MSKMVAAVIALGVCLSGFAQENVDLRLRLKAGEVYPLRIATHQDITQTFMDQSQQTSQETTLTYAIKVDSVDDKGTMTTAVTYERLRSNQEGSQGSATFDSAAKVMTDSPQAKVYGALAGQAIKVTLAPSGAPASIQGADELVKRIVNALQPAEGLEAETTQKSIELQFGEAALRENIGRNLEVYPEKPVTVGESWVKKFTMTSGFPVTTETTYTLKSIENGAAVIDVRSTISAVHTTTQPVGGQGKMSYDLAGTQTGSMTLDLATGWYREAAFDKELSGDIVFEGGAGESKRVPLTVKSKETIDAVHDDAKPSL